MKNNELIIDNFAGGGGASTGIEIALGRSPDYAINHDREAIEMHKANHPDTEHLCEDMFDVDPEQVAASRPVGLAWFSPDCTYHSKARGGKPFRDRRRANRRRGLAWIVVKWARAVRPRVIMLENVEEFQDWGPLDADNKPCPRRKGLTFRRWRKQLENLGYQVELRELRACDYGAPTIRKRLFIIARCDGQPIVWPKPTHGPGHTPYRTAAECIDWSLPCPSIFDRPRPLAENTMKRIARGVQRFVLENPKPYIVTCNHGGKGFRGQGIDEPMKTITASHDAHGLAVPYFIPRHGERPDLWRCKHCREVFDLEPTCGCTACGAEDDLIKIGGQAPRSRGITDPMPTVTATANGASLVAAFLAKHYGGHETPGTQCELPLSTITSQDHHAVVAAQLKNLVAPQIIKENPHLTHELAPYLSPHLINLKGSDRRMSAADQPAPTVCAEGNHAGLVAALMAPYYGSGSGETGRDLFDPAPTVTSKDRLQLVTVNIDGETYVLTDIGMRMLQPRELYNAQGFPPDYIIDIEIDGKKLSKAGQVRMCGNSVPPTMAQVLVEANYQANQIEKGCVA